MNFCVLNKSVKLIFDNYWLLFTIIIGILILTHFYFKVLFNPFAVSLITFFLTNLINYYNEIKKSTALKKYLKENILICSKIILENFIDYNIVNKNFDGNDMQVKKFRDSKDFKNFIDLKDYNFSDTKYLFNNTNDIYWNEILKTYFQLNNLIDINRQDLVNINNLANNYQNHFKPNISVSSDVKDKINTISTIKNLCAIISSF